MFQLKAAAQKVILASRFFIRSNIFQTLLDQAENFVARVKSNEATPFRTASQYDFVLFKLFRNQPD